MRLPYDVLCILFELLVDLNEPERALALFGSSPPESIQHKLVKRRWEWLQYLAGPDQLPSTILMATKINYRALEYARGWVPESAVIEAIQQEWRVIIRLHDPSETTMLAAVMVNIEALKHMRATKAVQLAAVRKDGTAIRYINCPDRDVQLAAMRQTVDAIKHIRERFAPSMWEHRVYDL